jgi:hypothetical protein
MDVTVPGPLARRVAGFVVAGLRLELAVERERGGRFDVAPYVALVRNLEAAARMSDAGHTSTRPAEPDVAQVMTAGEWARRHGRSGRSVRRDCATGRLPARRVGGMWLIDITEVRNG